MLLMDEPFSALDNETRRPIRARLHSWRKKTAMPVIHVTHDLREALAPGTQVIPLVHGRQNSDWLRREQKILAEESGQGLHFPQEPAFAPAPCSPPSAAWLTDIPTALTNPVRPSAPQSKGRLLS